MIINLGNLFVQKCDEVKCESGAIKVMTELSDFRTSLFVDAPREIYVKKRL